MEDKIKELLQKEGSLMGNEIAITMGKRKVKDIQKVLDKLLKNGIIKKSKIQNRLQWSLADELNTDIELNKMNGDGIKIYTDDVNIHENNKQTQKNFNCISIYDSTSLYHRHPFSWTTN